jgi:peroxiredoxin
MRQNDPVSQHMKLVPPAVAPAFTLPNQKGDPTSLASLLERGPLLLTFHRGTW